MSPVPLTAVPRVLREMTGCTSGPTYSLLYRLGLAGRLPITIAYGRYFIDMVDLPAVAVVLDLRRGEPAPRTSRRVKEPAPPRPEAPPKRWNARLWNRFINVNGRDPASLEEFSAWCAERERAAASPEAPRSSAAA
jgi:hypothetical protein